MTMPSGKIPAAAGWLVFVMAYIFLPASYAQESETVRLPFIDMPPVPGEEELVGKVFERFPGIERGEVLKVLGENFSAELGDFRRLAMADAARAVEILHGAVREAVRLAEIRKKDPGLYGKMVLQKRLDEKSAALAMEFRKAKTVKERLLIRDGLKKVLDEAFSLKQDLMKKDVQQMEEELGRLKELVDKRQENREAIIGRRLSELTVETGYLEW